MFVRYSCCFVLLLTTLQVDAQSYLRKTFVDVTAAYGSNRFAPSISWNHTFTLTRKIPKLQVGYGIRFTTFIGANRYYSTAPAKFTSPVQGPTTIFSKNIDENIDTITTATTITNSINAQLHIVYQVINRVDVGFNIDVIGASFGPEKSYNIISSSFDPNQAPVVNAKPTSFNLLLTSDNDIGSLNSEFYLRYRINQRIAIRGGLSFIFSEVRTLTKLSFNNGEIMNDRYRHKAGMLMLGVSFKPF